ncbi:hypothetical protein MC885_003028 [Smutsia gigantea]|nr:hypothetical protein MC885_003028 [Smutsia gigantea]
MEDQCLVPAHEACQSEDKCPTGPVSEPELQEEQLKLEEERFKQEKEALEERVSRLMASTVRPSHGSKRKPVKAEAELPQGLPLHREEPEGSQSEPSPSAKQRKKAKKRRSLGAPVLPAMASTVSAPSETLGQERKAQRLRPLYRYINYCNPELNQAGEGDREAETVVETELELALEEAGVEQLQTLLPMAALEEPGGLPNVGMSSHLKAEVGKSTQVDIGKMLSVCAAPFVPQLSPQYK